MQRSQTPFAHPDHIKILQPPIAPNITLCAPLGACTALTRANLVCTCAARFTAQYQPATAVLHALLPSLSVCRYNTASGSSVISSADQ
jgi:hypothetical protein